METTLALHPAAPNTISKSAILKLALDCAPLLGINRTAQAVLRRIFEKLPTSSFHSSQKTPICFEKQKSMAEDLCISRATFLRAEHSLEKAGYIVRPKSNNGFRGPSARTHDGKGISLAPLIFALERLKQLHDEHRSGNILTSDDQTQYKNNERPVIQTDNRAESHEPPQTPSRQPHASKTQHQCCKNEASHKRPIESKKENEASSIEQILAQAPDDFRLYYDNVDTPNPTKRLELALDLYSLEIGFTKASWRCEVKRAGLEIAIKRLFSSYAINGYNSNYFGDPIEYNHRTNQ